MKKKSVYVSDVENEELAYSERDAEKTHLPH